MKRIVCAIPLSRNGFARERVQTFLAISSALPAVGFALPTVGFKDTASHNFFYGNPCVTARV
ncbi:MAG: hypothetical protein Q7T29_14780 [Gallionella sp.]|nr:hypothetical protein [Gallionella sp.]